MICLKTICSVRCVKFLSLLKIYFLNIIQKDIFIFLKFKITNAKINLWKNITKIVWTMVPRQTKFEISPPGGDRPFYLPLNTVLPISDWTLWASDNILRMCIAVLLKKKSYSHQWLVSSRILFVWMARVN